MTDFKFEVGNHKTVRDTVFETIRKGIVNGHIKPGERIIESQLAEKMNVSRTPIREALRRLEAENFVEHLPRKGMIVSLLEDSQVIEIFNIRAALEALAISIAIDNLDDKLIKNLEDSLHKMSDSVDSKDIKLQIKYNTEFHEHILYKTNSPRLITMLSNLKEQVQCYRYQSLSLQGRPSISLNEHIKILELIKTKNKDEAEKYIKDHITKAGEALVKNHNLSIRSIPENNKIIRRI